MLLAVADTIVRYGHGAVKLTGYGWFMLYVIAAALIAGGR